MAPPSILLHHLFSLLSIFFFFTTHDATAQNTNSSRRTRTFLLPIVRDTDRSLISYYTSIQLGTPPVKLNLTIDIGHQVTWIYPRGINHYNENKSSTKQPFPCTCPPKSDDRLPCLYQNGGCMINMCSPYIPCNDFDQSDYYAYLIRDLITLYQRRGGSSPRQPRPPVSSASLPNFSFGVAETDDDTTLNGLSKFSSGVVSLSRSPLSLNNQLADYYKTPRKFALCLPSSSSSSNGVVYFGGGPYFLPPNKRTDLSTIMLSTDIITVKFPTAPYPVPRFRPGDIFLEYMINITSIKIDQTQVPFNTSLLGFGNFPPGLNEYFDGGSKLNTMIPYTALIGEIYTPFMNLFIAKAEAMNMTRIDTYEFYPFEACFNTTSIRYDRRGVPQVPVIDFMMEENRGTRWRVLGGNSMVSVSKDIMCMAFIESVYYKQYGVPLASIMIGGKQMEDNLIEFDQESMKLRFNAFPLSKYGTSCSQFKRI